MRRTLVLLPLLLLPAAGQAQEVAPDLLRGAIDSAQPNEAPRRGRPAAQASGAASDTGQATAQTASPAGRSAKTTQARARVVLPKPVETRPNPAVRSPAPDQAVAPGLSPLPLRPRLRGAQDDAYQPLGIRIGNLRVFTGNEVQLGYDANTARTEGDADRRPSLFVRDEANLRLDSDWSEHQLRGELTGGYSRYVQAPEADRPDLTGRLALGLDVSRDSRLEFETRARIDSQTPNSADLAVQTSNRPLIYQYGAATGITQRFNRLQLSLRGAIDRTTYDAADVTGGGTLDQSSRDLTDYAVKLRAGYEITPGLVPFAEIVADTRQYDDAVDASGFRRSSRGLVGRFGTTIEFSRILTGEIGVGYGSRTYDDGRLKDLKGAVADAALIWAVTPLTTATLRAASTFQETTLAGSSGAIARRVSLDINHQLLRNLALGPTIGFTRADYDGIGRRDDTADAGFKAEYRVNRNFSLRGSYTFQRILSTTIGQSSISNVWLIGARADL